MVSVTVVLVCVYGAALGWAASNGVILGLDLVPNGFRSRSSPWPFSLSAGLLVAAAALWLESFGRGPRGAAIIAGASVGSGAVVGAIAITMASHPGLASQAPWQRLASFAAESPILAMYSAIMLLVAMSPARTRSPSSGAQAS